MRASVNGEQNRCSPFFRIVHALREILFRVDGFCLRKKKSSKYLPPEIWTQIFTKFPAKSLVRIRCVCKYWCSIIDDPDFVHLHLQLFQINHGNNQLFVAFEGNELNIRGDRQWSLTLRDSQNLRNTYSLFWKSYDYFCIIGSCNGLLLVAKCSSIYFDSLILWNPCIRKSLLLPHCPIPCYLLRTKYLLGYSPDSKDYKVVAFTYEFDDTWGIEDRKIHFAVYTLRDQLWTVRNLDITNTSMFDLYSLSTAVFFRGAAYWLVNNDKKSSGLLTHLGSFDFDNERITFLELPISLDKTSFLWFLFLLGDSLAIFSISKVTSSIWVLKRDNIKLSWTLWFSGKSSPEGYEVFESCYGKFGKVFYCNGGYFVCGKLIYNIASCQVQEFYKSMSSTSQLERYSESLVLSNAYGACDLRVMFPLL
ncbi:F-box/kelch-repeat protein At3g23880-like [Silene latifolia]|uniref:F-box/kelch-repeat protein At3g23880-like n=1 Tax=Silene latifolia TaxID=37657 RepID=UPI003D78A142